MCSDCEAYELKKHGLTRSDWKENQQLYLRNIAGTEWETLAEVMGDLDARCGGRVNYL